MKKFLSLVLALVMTMSLVTISAGAEDFTDNGDIQYEEAVDVMSAIGIIDGYTDGSFNPDGTLTRGAAAKIICNLILGPTTAAALSADTAPYRDVPIDHTFAGYIAYCQQQGIISGYADGSFRPAATLTGYAFMKMLLGALGYDAEVEGYVGSNWSIQVAKRALNVGMDDGLVDDFVGTKAVTREEACLYAFNTLTADMVQYDSKTNISIGGAEVIIAGSEAEKIPYSDSKDYRESVENGTEDDGYQQFCELYFPKLRLEDQSGKTDDFGRPSNTWYNKNDKIGTYKKAADVTYTEDVKSKTIYADLDLSKPYDYELIIDGVQNIDVPVIKRDGQLLPGNDADDKIGDLSLNYSLADESNIVGNGSLIEVFEDEQVITIINTYLMQVSGDYNEKREELSLVALAENDYPIGFGGATLSSDDFDGLEEYEDEDYVMVTIAEGTVKSIALCEPVVAAVTEYVHEESLTAGGETYEYSAANNDNAKAYTLKEDCELYLDPYGNILWADAVTSDKYVFIYEFANANNMSSKSGIEANAYFTDGTNEVININKINTVKVTGSDMVATGGRASTVDITGDGVADIATGWFKWTEKDGKYSLTSIGTQYNQAAETVTDPANAIIDYSLQHTEITVTGQTTYDGTTKTNFIILEDDGDVRVYTGIKNVPDVYGAATGTATVVDTSYNGSGYAVNVFIDLNDGTVKGGNTSSDIIFLLEAEKHGNDSDDDEYYRYSALVNGEETTVKYDKDVDPSGTKAGTLWFDVEYTGKNYVTYATELTGPVAANRDEYSKDTVSGTTVTLTGTTLEIGTQANNDYYMADSYKIFKITGDEYETLTMKQLVREGVLNGSTIYGILNGDGEYTALYIYHA